MEIIKFSGHSTELYPRMDRIVKCKLWRSSSKNSSTVVYSYDFGQGLDHEDVNNIANHINKEHDMNVLVIEYYGTSLKYSDGLLKDLEKLLPDFLDKVKIYMSEKYKNMIDNKLYQDVINELYFDAFAHYPITKENLIALYGQNGEYQDFGIASSMDILYGIKKAKELYPDWNWDNCIGFGSGYGSYIIQLAQKLVPNTFSMIIDNGGYVEPIENELFTNLTEWEHGEKRLSIKKTIGKFPIFLVQKQGWTTNQYHENAFKPYHFDIRNLNNDAHLNMYTNKTNIISYELNCNDDKKINDKQSYIKALTNHSYNAKLEIINENSRHLTKKNKHNKSEINLNSLFDYSMSKYQEEIYSDNINKDLTFLPVYKGVYVVYDLDKYPRLIFIPGLDKNEKVEYSSIKDYIVELAKENKMIETFINKHKNVERLDDLIKHIENPIETINMKYKKLVFKEIKLL